jgi:hypothetical protein
MADNQRREGLYKALGAAAALAAGYCARKLVEFGWKKVTGKEPPDDLHDPRVSIAEGLAWAVALGVTGEAARLLAARAATRNMRRVDAGAE